MFMEFGWIILDLFNDQSLRRESIYDPYFLSRVGAPIAPVASLVEWSAEVAICPNQTGSIAKIKLIRQDHSMFQPGIGVALSESMRERVYLTSAAAQHTFGKETYFW